MNSLYINSRNVAIVRVFIFSITGFYHYAGQNLGLKWGQAIGDPN